ncbi:helix-turn-helix domain-containing protein [Staphylococcus pettenkoferi]|uniref:helix-turn-helix domain-containing protein n=1 Tax=Staphylococcus pettenkoferi TaxID=170573 RepID=UPI002273ED04|nr:helix-turn-helix transcriptional regulator [Staphylococcus pettenkoferi]MCY1592831.1 helix-turn-helix domain-containing protein [Staphylococcus pettenkoferi]MCY1611470.1 helix-turn-helix domain-containing protein [Staphylococcus pettenkoferi]MCY1624220.1 helix-turn-helix domain-containing protein [Staphylococcus pettenkoferi]
MKPDLKARRNKLGLTLEEVGNIVGVGKSTVRKWETGAIENMKRDKIVKLANALKVSSSYIMGFEENNSNNTTSNQFETMAAHLDGELTEEEWNAVLKYAKFLQENRDK